MSPDSIGETLDLWSELTTSGLAVSGKIMKTPGPLAQVLRGDIENWYSVSASMITWMHFFTRGQGKWAAF